jgi:alpha-glucosidase
MRNPASVFILMILLFCFEVNSAEQVQSPNGKVTIEAGVKTFEQPLVKGNFLYYQVNFNQNEIVHPSPVLFLLPGGEIFGSEVAITEVVRKSINESSELLYGKSKYLLTHCNELQLTLEESNGKKRKFILSIRAYDDAAAFRICFCRSPGFAEMVIKQEQIYFRLLAGTAYVLPLKDFLTPYENNYEITSTDQLKSDRPIALPLLVNLNSGPWIALAEADLRDYPGMYLYPFSGEKNTLVSHLAPLRSDTSLAAKIQLPHELPWRVIMIADHPGKLIESNVILSLSEPSRLEDPSWIRPGKVAWDWWSDRVVEGRSFKGGMNTATMKYYIDFASDLGLEYMLIDAEWYGKHDTPDEDITTTIPEIDLPEILRHARERNVGIWLWLNWQCVRDQMDKAFPLYQQWGIKGVKVDYMNCDDQDMVNFYEEVCRQAARYHLMVNFHGAYKPTGLRRTYPNFITREGVLGLEWSKWSERCNPDHELILPFTRMLAGPMDFTPGAFQVADKKNFKAQYTAPMAMGTRAHQLAMYVVYENPLQMLVDHPASYFGKTGIDFLKVVPTTWDETRFISGEVGDYIILARRHSSEWYLGAMTDWTPRHLEVPLSFLGEGKYLAQIYADDLDTEKSYGMVKAKLQEVTANDKLVLQLVSGGGCAIRLIPTWEP